MTIKANLVLLITACLLVAALTGRSGALALTALPFLAYLIAGLLTSPGEARLRVTRQLSRPRAEPGDPVTHEILIENEGMDLPRLIVKEAFPPGAEVHESTLTRLLSLLAGEKISLGYTFSAPRGKYEWQTSVCTVSDPFGLFEKRYEIPAPATLRILPRSVPLRRLPVRLSQTLRTAGPNLSRLPGSGTDFWGVREYHPGDPQRSIHWRSAARHPGRFFTKQFEREEMANVGILLDARSFGVGAALDQGLMEYSIQAAASLARRLLRVGNRVSLLVFGERLGRVFPGTGKRQLLLILDQLAECQPRDSLYLDTLKYLPVRLFPANSLVVVISPLRPGDFLFFARLRGEGYKVLLISPDPNRYAPPEPPASPAGATAFRAARLERNALLYHLRQIGVNVIDWQVDEPLAARLGRIPRFAG